MRKRTSIKHTLWLLIKNTKSTWSLYKSTKRDPVLSKSKVKWKMDCPISKIMISLSRLRKHRKSKVSKTISQNLPRATKERLLLKGDLTQFKGPLKPSNPQWNKENWSQPQLHPIVIAVIIKFILKEWAAKILSKVIVEWSRLQPPLLKNLVISTFSKLQTNSITIKV